MMSNRVARYLRHSLRVQTVAFLVAACAASLIAVLFTQLFKAGETFFRWFQGAHPVGVWLWTPACFVASWYLVWRFAPQASGSGIPQVLAAKDEKGLRRPGLVDRLLSLKIVPVKMASAVLGVAGGGVFGREGPTLQIGASVYRVIQRWTGCPETDKGIWITAGAATGLAAAFNTPLGGIVFAIEELRLASFHRFRTVLLSSIIVGGLVSQWLVGSYLYLGTPSVGEQGFAVFPYALLVGVVGGALGGFFGRLLGALTEMKARRGGWGWGLVWALGCGFLVAGFASLDGRLTGSGAHLMNDLLFNGEKTDGALFAGRFAALGVSYMAGGGGGIFAPSLSAGACLGSWLGVSCHGVSSNLMVLLGMIAFLTGVTRTPFTAFVLVLEMTDRHSAIFPMMVAALAAELASRLVQRRGFYEVVKERFLREGGRS